MTNVKLDRSGATARLLLDRPPRNGMTKEMLAGINGALETVAADRSIQVLVLAGQGGDFSVGADIGHYTDDPDTKFSRVRDWTEFRAVTLLHDMPAITIAAVRGGCAGAGLGLAAACDLRVASTTARFNTAFIDVGVAGDMGLPWLLPRLLGSAVARRLCYIAGKFDGAEAFRIGLVSDLFDDARFDEEVAALAERLSRKAPLALRALKENFVAAERMGLADYIALESERHNRLLKTADAREAFTAFAEKRRPRFSGT